MSVGVGGYRCGSTVSAWPKWIMHAHWLRSPPCVCSGQRLVTKPLKPTLRARTSIRFTLTACQIPCWCALFCLCSHRPSTLVNQPVVVLSAN